jgi:hypothetical protein
LLLVRQRLPPFKVAGIAVASFELLPSAPSWIGHHLDFFFSFASSFFFFLSFLVSLRTTERRKKATSRPATSLGVTDHQFLHGFLRPT